MKGKDKGKSTSRPAQIPLLEDVVFHTSLPLPDPPRRRRADDHDQQIVSPQTPDLFGGSPEPGSEAPLADTDKEQPGNRNEADEEIIEGIRGELRQKTSSIIDSLVDEYSTEIVRRLRDELTSLLADLENKKP